MVEICFPGPIDSWIQFPPYPALDNRVASRFADERRNEMGKRFDFMTLEKERVACGIKRHESGKAVTAV